MNLACYTYRFPFINTFKTVKNNFKTRKGILIHLQKNGIDAWGEAAPLPGFSPETMDQLIDQLRQLQPDILPLFSDDFTLRKLGQFVSDHTTLPSLQFCLYTLGCFYLSQKHKLDVGELLFENTSKAISLNTVIDLGQHDFIGQVHQCVQQGFQTIKIKAKNRPEFVRELKVIRKNHPTINIRLDANQSWTLPQATRILQQIESLNIEYCEEPLVDPDSNLLAKLGNQTDVPIALDESLSQTFSLTEAREIAPVLIIKPMILGINPQILTALESISRHEHCKIIFTSSLESGIGRLMTAFLAAGLGTKKKAHGMATGNTLALDVWDDEHFIKNGSFYLPDSYNLKKAMRLNPSQRKLEKIKF